MKRTNDTDAARIELLLAELRLPAMKLMWGDLAARADKEGWPASRFLAALAEHEVADRGQLLEEHTLRMITLHRASSSSKITPYMSNGTA